MHSGRTTEGGPDATGPGPVDPGESASPVPAPPPPGALAPGSEVRVDVWLWATRQTRSRSQATSAARAGHVRVNGDTAKASQKVRVGDEVRLRVEGFDRVLEVRALLVKRVGAAVARQCYLDHSPEVPRPVGGFAVRDRGAGRPSKRERRELDRLRGRDSREHG
ncbi:RNA-binding S4 domain-containing protein [Actinomyces polynesiensis]|uniref:RNA-binding S4 domain-containing protein n=1 Tax=Actinomyces polynesiensis TaxID=1325934 RepID=UPI0009E6478A|nr:RNA-binding S4 domain-containing protein [Actinomyces polynesiensis]